MGVGSVTVVLVNNNQGGFTEVERTFLFIGKAANAANLHKVLAISAQTDLDVVLGAEASDLKTQLEAARQNAASDNWGAYALPFDPAVDDWTELLDAALEKPNDLKIEAVALCEPVMTAAEVTAANAAMYDALSKYAKYLTCHLTVSGIGATESWPDYATRVKAVITGIAATRVAVVPQLHGNNLGVVCGRLCNPAVTIADTPMRVATGALIGLGPDPVDKDGVPLTMADIKDLAQARFSVPQWYNGYNGLFWADHALLDNDGGDFQVYEHLRVLDYLARRVRILAIARVADRRLNNTPKSIATNGTYFMRPLREASRSIMIGGEEFPAMIQPPEDGDIEIIWTTNSDVSIAITAAPYTCPKRITVYLALDLNRGLTE